MKLVKEFCFVLVLLFMAVGCEKEPTKPAEPTKSTDPSKLTDPTKPTEPPKPNEPTASTKPAKSLHEAAEAEHAILSQMCVAETNVLHLVASGNDRLAQEALDSLIADFNGHPYLPEVVFRIGEEYYYRAFEDPDKCVKVISVEYFKKPKDIWERIVAQWPESESIGLKHAYYFAAVCYYRLGEYENALAYYQKVVGSWPDYEFAWSAQYLIGSCYERLRDSGVIPESEANVKSEEAYKAVVEKYPKGPLTANACLKLGRLNLKRQQKAQAAMYFELFLAKARPADPRIKSIKATLEGLKREQK